MSERSEQPPGHNNPTQLAEGMGGMSSEGLATGGSVIRNNLPPEIWAQIDAGSNPYAFTQIDETDAPAFPEMSLTEQTPVVGTLLQDDDGNYVGIPAYEINGNENVPVGAKVRMNLSPTFAWWEFEYIPCSVTSVCPVFTYVESLGLSVVTSLIVAYTCPDGTTYCEVSPTDCCTAPPPPPPPPPPGISCPGPCPTAGIPQTLYATLQSGGAIATGDLPLCVCTTAMVESMTLVYNNPAQYPPVPYEWYGEATTELTPEQICTLSISLACGGAVLGVGISSEGSIYCGAVNSFGSCAVTSCDPFCATVTFQPYPYSIFSEVTVYQISATPSGVCGSPATTYTCSTLTGACTAVYDGSGPYASLSACQAACGQGMTSYNCVGGTCVQVGGSGGTYATLADCTAGCSGSGDTGCSSPPSTATGTLSRFITSGAGSACSTCSNPTTIALRNSSGHYWVASTAICGVTLALSFSSASGWSLGAVASSPPSGFTATLVSGTCTGNELDVVFNVSYTSSTGCNVAFTITFTNP